MFARVWKAVVGTKSTAPQVHRRGPTCPRCAAAIGSTTRRCTRCGARLQTGPELAATVGSASRPASAAPSSPLERKILTAALPDKNGIPTIRVLPSTGTVVGEIKVRKERIFGDEAVRTVARLVKAGDLIPMDGGFVLSAAGRHRAASLRS